MRAALSVSWWCALLPAAVAGQRAELERTIHRQLLANGLEVIVVENHGVPLATVEVDVKNGAFTQTPEFAGLAHMYEHMFFKANERYPDPETFLDRAGELGAVFNGTTQEERVNYFLTLPADSVAGGIAFLAAALRAPLFRPDELEREKRVVIGEYDRNESNPFFRLTTAVDQKLWSTAYSRKNTLGDRNVILSVTPAKMKAIQQAYYVPNNSALIVSGDVSPPKIFALAQQLLGDWPRGADPFVASPVFEPPPLTSDDAVLVEQPIGTVLVVMQWHGPSVGRDPQATYAADVFSDVLNQPGSKLQRALVDGGLFQSLTVNYYTLNHVGPITISGETTPDSLRRAIAALEHEISRFAEPGYFTAAELAPMKQQRAVGTTFGLERASGFAHQLGFWWSVASLEYYMGYVDNMAKQTTEDLRRYARSYIIGKPKITGVLLSGAARQAIQVTSDELAHRIRP